MSGLDPALTLLLRVSLALLLWGAALHKLRDPARFAAVVESYRIGPRFALRAAARAFAWFELAIGVALLAPRSAAWAGLGAALLFALYGVAIAINLLRGRVIDCGCGAPWREQPLRPALLFRNALLIAMALLAAAPSEARPWQWIDAVTVVGGVAWLVAIHAATDRLLAIGPAGGARPAPLGSGTAGGG